MTDNKLADALRDMLSGWTYIRQRYGDLDGVGWDRAEDAATAALAEHDTQPAPAPVQVEGWWRVEVSDSAGQIVAIEPGMLAGRDVGCGSDDATIRLVVEHLRSFIGEPAHPPAPAADGAVELPPLPEPTCLGFRNPCGITQLPDMGIYGYTSDQMHAYARAAIAALRQPVPDAWTPSGIEYDRSIHSNPDAKAWADMFVETFPGLADKRDLMIGWFASAMMAMHDSQQESRNAD